MNEFNFACTWAVVRHCHVVLCFFAALLRTCVHHLLASELRLEGRLKPRIVVLHNFYPFPNIKKFIFLPPFPGRQTVILATVLLRLTDLDAVACTALRCTKKHRVFHMFLAHGTIVAANLWAYICRCICVIPIISASLPVVSFFPLMHGSCVCRSRGWTGSCGPTQHNRYVY